MQLAFANLELVFAAGCLRRPRGSRCRAASRRRSPGSPAVRRPRVLLSLAYAGVVLFVEPFYVAAGFAMYLNRRVQLEAWDVEQEFRRAFG